MNLSVLFSAFLSFRNIGGTGEYRSSYQRFLSLWIFSLWVALAVFKEGEKNIKMFFLALTYSSLALEHWISWEFQSQKIPPLLHLMWPKGWVFFFSSLNCNFFICMTVFWQGVLQHNCVVHEEVQLSVFFWSFYQFIQFFFVQAWVLMHTGNELFIPEMYKKHFKLKLQMFHLSNLHVKHVGTILSWFDVDWFIFIF